jgi:DNA topoisomerase-3
VNPGWLTVYGREAQDEDTPTLAPVKGGEQVQTSGIEVKQSQTKPPARFTEASLLSAMEGAGKLVEDEELREAMSEKGLGTPATRAAIIEGLLAEQYLLRQGRELQATAKAFALMELLNGLGIPELTKPELTGDWEFQLRQVQRRQKSRTEFMTGIEEITRRMVDRAKILVLASHSDLLLHQLCNQIVRLEHGSITEVEKVVAPPQPNLAESRQHGLA